VKKILLISLLGLHLFLLIHLQFTAWPEVLSFPYLISKGFLLYKDAIHVYPPLLDFILLGIYKIFGFKLLSLEAFTWVFILLNDLLVFSLAKKLSGQFWTAFAVLFVYVLLQPTLEGNMLWYDTALVTPLLASLYFYLVKKNYWLIGISLATAVLIKQTAGIFVLVFLGYLISQKIKVTRIILPLAIAGGLFLVYLLATHSLIQFIDWNLYYPVVYWSKFPGYVEITLGKKDYFILILLALPVFIGVVRRKFFLALLFLACLIMVYPRFSYFHLQPALALSVVSISYLKKSLIYIFSLVIFATITLPAWRSLWNREAQFYSTTEFNQAKAVSDIVRPNEKVYFLGAFSTLYVLADRQPPKIWTDNFGWYLEIPGVQQKIINSWETNKPSYIVWQLSNVYQPKLITDWINRNYSKIGQLDNENSLYKLLPK
jgi:hypothetical protein